MSKIIHLTYCKFLENVGYWRELNSVLSVKFNIPTHFWPWLYHFYVRELHPCCSHHYKTL